jgi:squalene cyclase
MPAQTLVFRLINHRNQRDWMDIDKSIAFIEAKGSSLEKARLACILHGITPQLDVTQGFFELQNGDGGFPFGMLKGNLSTINETTVALWWLEELDLFFSTTASQAFTYLLSTQQADGSWTENPQITQNVLPPWIQVGDPRTTLYLSAYVAYWLALGGYTHLPAFRKAIHFLIRNQDKTGRFFGYLHTTWIATGVFLLAGDRYARIASLGIQALSASFLTEWDDSQIAWALDCLSRGGLPKNHKFVQGCLRELLRRQKPDGCWASEDGEAFAVGATIQALKVLQRYDLLTGNLDE